MRRIIHFFRKRGLHSLIVFCFWIYLILLIRMVLFKEPWSRILADLSVWKMEKVWERFHTANFVPLHTICLYLRYRHKLGRIAFANLVYNVVGFIPYGFFASLLSKSKRPGRAALINGILFSVAIEMIQCLTLLGHCDVDDVILNGLGVGIGVLIYLVVLKKLHKKEGRI